MALTAKFVDSLKGDPTKRTSHHDTFEGNLAPYSGPLFPSSTKIGQSSERAVLTRAMKRCCNSLGIVDASPHDLRRTGERLMASELCKVPGEIIARILNPTAIGSPVTQIYNRYDYAAAKRAAIDVWAAALMKVVTGNRHLGATC
jgi:integrase